MANKALTRSGNNSGLSVRNAFGDYFSPWSDWFNEPTWERALTMPAVNILENEKSYTLAVAAPGLKKDDFNVHVEGKILTISSEKKESSEDKGKDYTRCEYNYSSFSRSFTLPEDVKHDAVEAEYKDGELIVTVPKSKTEKKQTVKVAVK